jgi:hypothetical protein
MATKKSTRATPRARREKMAEIARRAFSAAIGEALEYSALANPKGTLRTVVDEYLRAMRAQLEWTEGRESEERDAMARARAVRS